ncbi:MAG TPA: bacillithiol biosynthesis deacetylase BshB1 [Gemmatimonadota bacterium]|nr:bacillithiol biosynthesis deacetylase BshB1 [Gemmatimonadota bacterium]
MSEALERARETGPVDVLAIAAHRDDVELTCGGTLLRCADRGHRTAILDLTRGEMGTRGSAELRGREAAEAARVLGASVRLDAGLPDAGLFNDGPSRRRVVAFLRALRPRTVILPFPRGRHPDHRIASELGRDACYLAGLTRYEAGGEHGGGESAEVGGDGGRDGAHRPTKVLYALSYREDPVKPTFVVDIAEQFDRKMEAIRCYASQFEGKDAAGEIFPTGQDLYDLIETQSRHYGSLIRRPYGEPFWTEETVAVDDIVGLSVRSM